MDGWAGASNSHPHPMPNPVPHTQTQRACKALVFPLFNLCVTEQRTDGPTDKASDRVASPRLKKGKEAIWAGAVKPKTAKP